jgi:hypothetical protein
MMVPKAIEQDKSKFGKHSFIQSFVATLKQNPLNLLSIENPLGLKKFPTTYDTTAFKPDTLSTHYALAFSPFNDLPAEHFANITGEYRQNPRIVMLDGGITGPVNRIMGYKFMTRLAMNGTEAADQNPPYVMVESVYRPELAAFLKEKFPSETRLVLKHVAAARGEGVVIINASTHETLDAELKSLLQEGSDFKKVSPLSICLIEKFVSTPEKSHKDEKKMVETVVRVVYLALQDQGKFELKVIDAAKAVEDPDSHESKQTHGMVKLGKWHDGRITVLSDDDLQLMESRVTREISAIAQRSIRFDPQMAVKHFLTSDNPILNLVGVELFVPYHFCSYREKIQQTGLRISDEQCRLFLGLLQRNQSPLLVERLFENSIIDAWKLLEGVPLAPLFPTLLKRIWDIGKEKGLQRKIESELIDLSQNLTRLKYTNKGSFPIEAFVTLLSKNTG